MRSAFEESAAAYYSGKLSQHGSTPAGVDWNSADSQQLRFDQLLKVCPEGGGFSLLDYGCGYGALLSYLEHKQLGGEYWGYDVSTAMVDKARNLHTGIARAAFASAWDEVPAVDYTLASGVFNVKQSAGVSEWQAYVMESLARIAAASKRGFAFNLLTSYSDPERMRA